MTNKERLKKYLNNEKKNIIFGLFFCLIFVICQISQPFLLGRALDTVKENDLQLFIIYLAVATALAIIGAIFYYIFEVISGKISQNIIKKMREEVYLKLNSVSVKEFDRRSHGDLLQLEIRDIEKRNNQKKKEINKLKMELENLKNENNNIKENIEDFDKDNILFIF